MRVGSNGSGADGLAASIILREEPGPQQAGQPAGGEEMATAPRITKPLWDNGYPTTDRKLLAETDTHRDLMLELIETLKHHFADQPRVYVSGNLLVFSERGNRRKHV